MVRELLFLVTSVIFVWIRGRVSEVTTTLYHIRSDFHLKWRSYHSGFVVLFLSYLSCIKLIGIMYTLGADRTIFEITLSVCTFVCLSICHPVHVPDFVWMISPEPFNHF